MIAFQASPIKKFCRIFGRTPDKVWDFEKRLGSPDKHIWNISNFHSSHIFFKKKLNLLTINYKNWKLNRSNDISKASKYRSFPIVWNILSALLFSNSSYFTFYIKILFKKLLFSFWTVVGSEWTICDSFCTIDNSFCCSWNPEFSLKKAFGCSCGISGRINCGWWNLGRAPF